MEGAMRCRPWARLLLPALIPTAHFGGSGFDFMGAIAVFPDSSLPKQRLVLHSSVWLSDYSRWGGGGEVGSKEFLPKRLQTE